MQDQEILSRRKAVIETAREANPIRWANGIRNCTAIGSVMLNPDNVPDKTEKEVA